jgi:hypothetical protein
MNAIRTLLRSMLAQAVKRLVCVRFESWLTTIVAEIVRGFTQFCQENVGTVLKSDNNRFLSHPFQFIVHYLLTIPCSVG